MKDKRLYPIEIFLFPRITLQKKTLKKKKNLFISYLFIPVLQEAQELSTTNSLARAQRLQFHADSWPGTLLLLQQTQQQWLQDRATRVIFPLVRCKVRCSTFSELKVFLSSNCWGWVLQALLLLQYTARHLFWYVFTHTHPDLFMYPHLQ